MNPDFKNYLLKVTQSSTCKEIEVIQSLWSGYGKISRYQLKDTDATVIVKKITLNKVNSHPRGWNTNNSHNRKVKSYEVETYWYEHWNKLCSDNCRVPKFIGSFSQVNDQWIVLEDLDTYYPKRKHQLTLSEAKVCLKWLANFHATFLNQKPKGLWEIGTYWNLDTRPDELKQMKHQELQSKAQLIDEILNSCNFQTIVHGDAKVANFCFSERGDEVAAVDFQYIGGGCGMKDVAYFLGSCLTSNECELYEKEVLDYYFLELKNALEPLKYTIDFTELEKEWRRLYSFACVDFTRFLLGWMPSHQKINPYNLDLVEKVLELIDKN